MRATGGCYKRVNGSSCTLHQYHFDNEKKTWTEAQRYCREKYTDMATITNMEEMNTLLNTVNGVYSGLSWIGLYDDLNSWRWSLDDDSFYKNGERDFRRWNINEPRNWNGNRENFCVYYAVFEVVWKEVSCSTTFPFMCFGGENRSYRYAERNKQNDSTQILFLF